ncbi:MAG: hypothetical protein M0Q22_04820 [Sulfuritalea sp.]|jgi:hypothetical protein|nr:hypothetical protein [Sulfuritalea sp.]
MNKDQHELSPADKEKKDDEGHRLKYLASLGNLAHRYPIKQDLWNKMEVLPVEGAALYSYGLDPDTIRQELEHCGYEDNSLDELPSDFDERIRIIKSAVIAGSIKRGSPENRKAVGCDDHTLIKISSFVKWREKHHADWKPAEATPAYPEYQPDYEPGVSEQQDGAAKEQPFDPLRTNGIALLFPLDTENTKNISIWKALAKNAKRNGLSVARIQLIGGKAQSRFDPLKVAEWLVATGKYTQKKVDQILSNNLPARSAHLKDFFAS